MSEEHLLRAEAALRGSTSPITIEAFGVAWAAIGGIVNRQLECVKLTLIPCREAVDLSPEALTATVWSGEGLPPVGCVCEFVSAMSDGEYWHPELKSGVRVEIVAHFNTGHGSGDVAAFVFDHRSGRQVEQAIAKCFRPLRTAEQLAADAREAAINRLMAKAARLSNRTQGQMHRAFWAAWYDSQDA